MTSSTQLSPTGHQHSTTTLKTRFMAGVMALGVAGVLVAQPFVAQTPVNAEPIRVDAPAPADFSPVINAVKPAVVSVKVKRKVETRSGGDGFFGMDDFWGDVPDGHPLEEFFRRFHRGEPRGHHDDERAERYGMSQGSGFFISEDGYVVTNDHVVEEGAEFTVVMDDGTEYPAKLVGSDPRTDLALLKVDSDKTFDYVAFSDDVPQVGNWVIAIGNPFGLGGTVTVGVVSARGRDIGAGPYDDFIQIDAPVNRGNSGGPAFNAKGEVIGINAAILSPSSGGNVGIAFAIPATTAKDVIGDLKEGGSVIRGWLGVQIQPLTKDLADSLGLKGEKGALIASVQKGSPADKSGLKNGDTILAVDGKEIKGPRGLSKMIAGYDPETEVTVKVWRKDAKIDVKVKLGNLEDLEKHQKKAKSGTAQDDATKLADLGLGLIGAREAGEGDKGVLVVDILPDSIAEQKGLFEGDLIVEVNGEPVNSTEDVLKAIQDVEDKGGKAVLLRVDKDGVVEFVALPLSK